MSLAQLLGSAVDFNIGLSALEALRVSIPWEAEAQGYVCRSRDPGWTGEGTGEAFDSSRCGHILPLSHVQATAAVGPISDSKLCSQFR